MTVNIADAFIDTIKIESRAVQQLVDKVPDNLDALIARILNCQGKLIVTGMGKSGLIGRKIAATLSSVGTPSFFVHPAEAYHGDLGMITAQDIVLAISNSGETEEILKLISFLSQQGNYLVSMTGNPESTLARHSDFHFDVAVEQEACPLQLAPTSSTTATLVTGDALAVTLMKARQFTPEDFAVFHPGGSLGRRLLTTVENIMRKDTLPLVNADTPLIDVVSTVTSGRLGIAIVVDKSEKLAGVITDGDLRRAMESEKERFFTLSAQHIMSAHPKTIPSTASLVDAEEMMAKYKVNTLLVSDNAQDVAGVVQIYDL
ncbi:KpsF/GutQ family sugar-phosphate isomerase [Aestuariibacter salexigens]|uniref:KpsF/GutQ family sugar-phosphate isomerase n=1 Tax=Aestuariibacter salexigens TaxID=226010 RepID=UPI00041CAFE2|nr:KpsF/GutQ family sugar-phosphate isomerase [Aestuariibacter salexigens]